ncbi:MAG: thermonuclease family protein [Chloroflexi bacterium]|nr:thermonuclease family protein [Chloroflexota bacterium]
MADHLMKKLKAHIRAGKKEQAAALLVSHLKDYPKDKQAWLLLSKCLDDPAKQKGCLKKVLEIDPKNEKARKGIQRLILQKEKIRSKKLRRRLVRGILVFSLVLPVTTISFLGFYFGSDGQTLASILDMVSEPLPTQTEYVITSAPQEEDQVNSFILAEPTTVIEIPSQIELEPTVDPLANIPSAYCVPTESPREVAQVVTVTDSESLHVELNGQLVTIRYIGIDAPELDQPYGAQAFDINRTLEGQYVILVKDKSDADEQGRLLRYVFIGEYFINYQFLEWGFAEAIDSGPNFACAGFFLVGQDIAMEQESGVWEPVDVRMDPNDWQNWPVIPPISKNAEEIYLRGVAAGNNPNHLSVMGDCQAPQWLLFGRYDWDTFELQEELSYLQSAVDQYAGNWGRESVTVAFGNTVASLYSVYWADRTRCESGESPMDCELRVNNPNVALIMLGTNWGAGNDAEFDSRLRSTVQYLIDRNVLPIIVNKADATGPNYPLNRIMAQVAYDFDIPLTNYWAAVQGLPNNGMDPNDSLGIHILGEAYPVKRITGLQTLDAILNSVDLP